VPGACEIGSFDTGRVLADDQDIDGYLLRSCSLAEISRRDFADVRTASLSVRPFDMDGVMQPPGLVIEHAPPGRTETMRDHVFGEHDPLSKA
jgi:hypothetical protein